MRFSFLPLAALSLSVAACSVSTVDPSSEGEPTFTAADVRPGIEGKWTGTVSGKPFTVTLAYKAAGVEKKCSNRTLAAGSVSIACIDVSSLELEGNLVEGDDTVPVNGQLSIYERTYQNRGELTLQGSTKASIRFNAMLADGKLDGSLQREDGTSVEVVLAR